MKTHGLSGSQSALELQAPPGGMGIEAEARTQIPVPVVPVTQFRPAQHGWFAPQVAPSIPHAQQSALWASHVLSPCAKCPATAGAPTVIAWAFARLLGGTAQLADFVSPRP